MIAIKWLPFVSVSNSVRNARTDTTDTSQLRPTIPQVIPFAENQIGFGEERGSDFAEPAVTTGTLEAVLVPELVQCFE